MDTLSCFPQDTGWAVLCGVLALASLRIHAPVALGAVACTIVLLHLDREHHPEEGRSDAVSARVAVRGDTAANPIYTGEAAQGAAPEAAPEDGKEGAPEDGKEGAPAQTWKCRCARPSILRRSSDSHARLRQRLHTEWFGSE